MPPKNLSLLKSLGPGLLFAGAAVGVSHLVQSTRAGADYGLALVGVILFANLIKYPAFSFGPRYAAATGTSLLEGYRRQGTWALWMYGLLTLGTMFTVQAAVTVVCAALLKAVFGLDVVWGSGLVLAVCVGLLVLGRYPWLEFVTRVIMAVLTITTVVAAAFAVVRIDASATTWVPPASILSDTASVMFLAALIGWMPSAIDISVWHSLWTLAKGRKEGARRPVSETLRDFNIGYVGTAALALCFVFLGAGVMHGTGTKLADAPGTFAGQVIAMFTGAIGEGFHPVIATACITVMFSTVLTVVDGFPRAIATLAMRFKSEETPQSTEVVQGVPASEASSRRIYFIAMAVIAVVSMGLIAFVLKSLSAFVDVATILSFCTAAPLSWLNHRAMFGPDVPAEAKPGRAMWVWSWLGIVFAAVFTTYFVWLRFMA